MQKYFESKGLPNTLGRVFWQKFRFCRQGKKWVWLLAGLAFLLQKLPAQNAVVEVEAGFRSVVLGKYLGVIVDTSKRLTIRDFIANVPSSTATGQKPAAAKPARSPFQPHEGNYFSSPAVDANHWFRFFIHNKTTENQELLLELAYPHVNLAQLFLLGDSLSASGVTGDHLPFRQRFMPVRYFTFPIELPPGDTLAAYLFINQQGEELHAPLLLRERKAGILKFSADALMHAALLLPVAMFLVVVCVLFLVFRYRFLLFEILHIIGALAFILADEGYGFQLIWSDSPAFADLARPVFLVLIFTAHALFLMGFLEVKKKLPGWHWYFMALIGVFLFYTVSFHPFHLIAAPNSSNYQVFLSVFLLLLLGFPVSEMVFLVHYFFKTRNKDSLFMLIALMCIIGAYAWGIFTIFGWLPYNYFMQQNIAVVGYVSYVISIGSYVAYRILKAKRRHEQMELELMKNRQQALQNLIAGQENERRRLSQELHDGASLQLAALQMRLSTLEHGLPDGENLRRQLRPILSDLNQVSSDIRNFSHALSPIFLERHGLLFAMENLIATVEQARGDDLEIVFDYPDFQEKTLGEPLKQSLFFIFQELLNNAVKHAKASRIEIRLSQKNGSLVMDFSDDGVGYATSPEAAKTGIGLQNIQSRTTLLGGSFSISRNDGRGARHSLLLPV